MRNFFGMFGADDENRKTEEEGTLRLHKEELDVSKDRVQTGEVTLGKEVVEEHKSVDVPVTHEEVVIERRAVDNERSDSPIGAEQTIRIPVSEEKVNVDKHTVVTGEVTAHKRELEGTKHIDETLKKEEARINTTGDTNVITNDGPEGSFH